MKQTDKSIVRCSKCKAIISESILSQKELDKRLKILPVYCSECGLK